MRFGHHLLISIILACMTSIVLGTPVTWCRVVGAISLLVMVGHIVWYADRHMAQIIHIFFDGPLPGADKPATKDESITIRWGTRTRD